MFATICKKNLPPEWTLQQDNMPCHKTKKLKNLFQKNFVTVKDWPAQSPNLNLLENLWDIIKAQIKKDKPQKLDDLRKKKILEQDSQRSLFETHLIYAKETQKSH